MRSQLQLLTPVAKSCQPRGASPAVGSGWLDLACRFAFSCLLQLGPLVAGSEAIAADRLETKTLVEMANRYQIPMPPKDARVVFASNGYWTTVGRGPLLTVYSPAFLLEERPEGSIVILRGLRREVLSKRESTDPSLTRPFAAKDIDPRAAGYIADFHSRAAFVCAVQLASRGDDATAQGIWRRVVTTTSWTSDRFGVIESRGEDGENDAKNEIRNPARILAESIFDFLESGCRKRTPIGRRLTSG
jgi:hypothetical protein